MLRLEKNGNYWRAEGRAPNGMPVRISLGNRAKVTQTEARSKMLAATRRLLLEGAVASRPPTLNAWCEEYTKGRTDAAGGTIALFEQTTAYLVKCFAADLRMDRITRADAAKFRKFLGEQDGIESIATVRGHLRRARQMFGEAKDQDRIGFNPFDREECSTPKGDVKFQPVDDAIMGKLLDACPGSGWRCLLALCRWAGLRRGEALRLEWRDIDFATNLLHVVSPEQLETTKKRTRIVPLEPRHQKFLLAEQGTERPCAGVPTSNLHRDVEAIIRRAGFEPWSDPFHALRKNLVSEWQAKYPPLDVAKWLGHSVQVAADNYHRTMPEVLEKVTGVSRSETDLLKAENEELKRRLAALEVRP